MTVVSEAAGRIDVDEAAGTSRVALGNRAPVEEITFEETISGAVRVAELDREPERTGSVPGTMGSVKQIEVPENATETGATIRLSIDAERLEAIDADPSELRVNRFNDSAGEWQELSTEIVNQTDNRTILEAETPGFSIFAVSAVSDPVAVIEAEGTAIVDRSVILYGGSSTDRHGEIVDYRWQIVDERHTGESVTTRFDDSGSFRVVLTVENDAGKTDTAIRTLTIGDDLNDTQSSGLEDRAETTPAGSGIRLAAIGPGTLVALLVATPFLRRVAD